MQRGLWPAPKGLNRRLQIREFVTGFDRQQCRTKRRPRPAAPAQLRLPREHPKVPNRRVLPKGSTDGRRSPGGGQPGPHGSEVAGYRRGVSRPGPALGRSTEAAVQSLLVLCVCSLLEVGAGSGMRSHWRNVRNGVKKKAAWERSASRQLPAAAALFYYVI